MHLRHITLFTLFLTTSACLAQSSPCGQPLDAALRSGALLTIDSKPAGIDIVTTDAATEKETIHITCTAAKDQDPDSATQTHLQLSGTPTHTKLTITGPHIDHHSPQIRIELPRKVNLDIQMPAGQVTVNDIVGDKRIELHAGQITISSTHKWNYKDVDVSVSIGQVSAPVYGPGDDAEKGGFFRTLHKQNPTGEYRLHAHVTTGQIELLGKPTHSPPGPQ
jgi:hypothetical protein